MKLKMTGRQPEDVRRAAAEALGREVHAAAECTYAGQLGALVWMQAIPIVGLVLRRRGKHRAHGLPQLFILAVTEDQLVAVGTPKVNWNVNTVKATEALRSFPLTGARASTADNELGCDLTVELPGDRPFVASVTPKESAQRLAELINGRA